MKPAIVTGFLLGLIHSIFNLYAMLTRNPLALTTWNRINGLLYFALVIALITLSATLIRRAASLTRPSPPSPSPPFSSPPSPC